MKQHKQLERDERELSRKLQDADLVKQVTQHDGWKVITGMVSEKLQNYVNALCVEDVTPDNTTKLRAKIAELREIIKIPQMVSRDIEQHTKRVQGLRLKQERLQSVGLDTFPQTGEQNG